MRLKASASQAIGVWIDMLKYLGKFALDILPSVVATVLGGYIVTHYVNKPAAPPPPAVADIRTDAAQAADPKAADLKPALSDDRGAADGAQAKPRAVEKAADKRAAPERRPHQVVTRDKPASALATPPVVAATAQPPAAASEERRDATELARAAIDRLRNAPDARTADPVRPVEVSHAAEPVRVVPLPPAMTIAPTATASMEPLVTGSLAPARSPDDAHRLTPPADIPLPIVSIGDDRPSARTMAEGVVSAARSMFHAVIPGH